MQRPIPVWFGATSPPAYRRVGRLGDGWFPQTPPGPKLDEARKLIEEAATEAGRDATALGMEGFVSWGDGGAAKLVEHVRRWRDAGASHVAVNTMGAGLKSVDEHMEVLGVSAEALEIDGA